jgi:hypothetical protein
MIRSLAPACIRRHQSPLPALFSALRNLVEKGLVPGRIDLCSSNASLPCSFVYPQKAVLIGASLTTAASYDCR